MQGGGEKLTYKCWGDDHEDLTEQVEREIAAAQEETPTFYALDIGLGREPRQEKNRRQVMVTCREGHENVFDVEIGDG